MKVEERWTPLSLAAVQRGTDTSIPSRTLQQRVFYISTEDGIYLVSAFLRRPRLVVLHLTKHSSRSCYEFLPLISAGWRSSCPATMSSNFPVIPSAARPSQFDWPVVRASSISDAACTSATPLEPRPCVGLGCRYIRSTVTAQRCMEALHLLLSNHRGPLEICFPYTRGQPCRTTSRSPYKSC